MENITLSDPARVSNEQQRVTSGLFGTTNTDVTKGMSIIICINYFFKITFFQRFIYKFC
jgi:hypothetical protein